MRKLSIVAVVLLLTACGSIPSRNHPSEVTGTVKSIDAGSGLIHLDDSYVYFDKHTRVVYHNTRSYRPTDLERGDEVRISGFRDGSRFVADTITVTRNVRRK